MKSTTTTLFPMFGALKTAFEFKDQSRGPWTSKNKLQAQLLETLYSRGCEDLTKFSKEEMKYLASFSAGEINSWLKENGFDIKLDPFENPTDFGAASIMDVLVKWVVTGKKTKIYDHETDSKEHEGVILNSGYDQNSIEFKCDIKVHRNPIASVTTKNGDVVHMTIADKPANNLDLLVKVEELSKVNTFASYKNLHFPMVDIDDKPDISWLAGMFFEGVSAVDNIPGQMTIKQALQQTRFKMNDEGARVKSAVAVGMMRCTSVMPSREPPPMIIDQPFFLWITRKDVTTPYFAAYFNVDSWKDPGSLKMPGDK